MKYSIGEFGAADRRERFVAWRPAGDPIEDGMVLSVNTQTVLIQVRERNPILDSRPTPVERSRPTR